MVKKKKLRIASGVMLVVAIVFVVCALSNPALGTAFYIFDFRVGAAIWRKFYLLYLILMAGIFTVSFWVKE